MLDLIAFIRANDLSLIQGGRTAGDQWIELISTLGYGDFAQPLTPLGITSVLLSPRPQPPAQMMERVLLGHSHSAMGLVACFRCPRRSLIGHQLCRRDFELGNTSGGFSRRCFRHHSSQCGILSSPN